MMYLWVGLGTEFRSEKIQWNTVDSEWFPFFHGRKHSFRFRGTQSSAEEPIPKLGTEQNGEKFSGKN
jgi:hypothetical protein